MPERAGDVDVDRRLDRLDAVADLVHQPLVGAADGGDDAELGGAGRRGLLGGLDQLRDVEPHRAHGRVNWPDWLQKWQSSGQPPVLRLTDPLDLDLGPAPRHPHLVRQLEQLGDLRRRAAAAPRRSSSYDSPSPRVEDLGCGLAARMSVTRSKIAVPHRSDVPVDHWTSAEPGPDALRRLSRDVPASADELLAFDREHVWHPYASMTDPRRPGS